MNLRAIELSSPAKISRLKKEYGLAIADRTTGATVFRVDGAPQQVRQAMSGLLAKPEFGQQLDAHVKDQGLFFALNRARWPEAKSFLEEAESSDELSSLTTKIDAYWSDAYPKQFLWSHPRLNFSGKTLIMGILNVTPDSFSDGGRHYQRGAAIDHALEMIEQGAAIIDIGGESTRPGALPVSAEQELARVIPVIEGLRQKTDILISIDTYKSTVARAALQAGADIVNDISGATFDKEMPALLSEMQCPVIIMHIKGTPRNMQSNPHYDDVLEEVHGYFAERITTLNRQGVTKLILDPGIGFGKRLIDNLLLLRDLGEFRILQLPLLIGASRKSFIGRILENEVDQRLAGSLTANILAVQKGAQIVRVHDVQETHDCLELIEAIQNAENY